MASADFLIIGSGIAGLSVAIKLARRFPDRHCVVITKEESAESNTRYAQGGIAVVSDLVNDSFESHIQDTLEAGDGLCDLRVVEHVVHQAPERLRELIQMGADFDRDASGALLLGREGGHKANRIIHHRDVTGLNISSALIALVKSLPNITLLSHCVALDIIAPTSADSSPVCQGAWVLNQRTGGIEKYLASATVLATGGIGQLYQTTTNPLIATGDGIAMAWRAGARVSNMEFVQFHPTAFFDLNMRPAFLISEAVRGKGAYLRNHTGERFMFRHHIDGELACRDVVSRAIASEILAGGEPCVYLDCTHIAQEALEKSFPNIYKTCLARGIDMSKDLIPVAPAAHYLCGGIDVDLSSRSSVENLYACGECSNTGLHGANRLASNSLLEATVFAHNCFLDIEDGIMRGRISSPPDEVIPTPAFRVPAADAAGLKAQIQSLMTQYAGIVRDTGGLQYAYREVVASEDALQEIHGHASIETAAYEVRNMLTCAKLVLLNSLSRKENRGGFYNRDFALDQVAG